MLAFLLVVMALGSSNVIVGRGKNFGRKLFKKSRL